MNGMNPDPCASYSITDRFTCAKCGRPPRVMAADGTDTLTVVLSCHGESETISVTKAELIFNKMVFEEEDAEA